MRALLLLCLLALPVAAQDTLSTVLANMDKSAAGLETLAADIRFVKFSSFFGQEEVETGRLVVDLSGGEKNRKARLDLTTEPPYTQLVRGTKAFVWRPKILRLEEIDLTGEQARLAAAAFSTGLVASGKYLAEKYEITLEGREEAAGSNTVKLSLIPKDPDARNKVRKIEMWVSTSTWQPVQQKIYEAAEGEWRLYSYMDIERNPKLADAQFELDIPKGVKAVRPQK